MEDISFSYVHILLIRIILLSCKTCISLYEIERHQETLDPREQEYPLAHYTY